MVVCELYYEKGSATNPKYVAFIKIVEKYLNIYIHFGFLNYQDEW